MAEVISTNSITYFPRRTEGDRVSWTNDLKQEISGRVLNDPGALEGVATDFGRIIVRRPQVVVRPESAEDVARVVKFAARHSLSVATRGAGHSQAGQSLSDQIV